MIYIKTLKDQRIPLKSFFVVGIIISLILIEIFFKGSYLDEVLGILSGIYLLYLILKYRMRKEDFMLLLVILAVLIAGIIGNMNSELVKNKFIICVDIIVEFKVLLVFFAFKYFVTEEVKDGIVKILYKASKYFIILAFVFAIITLFIDTGMYDSKRYGLPSYKFIFPMSFQFFIVELLALYVIIEYKNLFNSVHIKKYILMCIITMILITKGPPIIFSFVFIILMYYFKRNEKIKLKVLIPIIVIGILLGSFQIKTYLMNENAPRYLFFKYSFVTADTYFPFGSGFATFGSDMAARNYSKLYFRYGFDNLFGMNREDSSFMSDTFWPMAIGQFGWIFGILYIIVYVYLFKFIGENKYSKNVKAFLYATILQFYIHAIGSAILSSSAGVLGFMILGIIIIPKKKGNKT